MKQKAYLGWGGIDCITSILKESKSRNILLVRGTQSYSASGVEKAINQIDKKYAIRQFIVKSPLPTLETITEGIACARSSPVDIVIAVGGGTVLDTAKSIAALTREKTNDYVPCIMGERSLQKKPILKLFIPTTAGTGSEATHFAVVYINNKKYSFTNNHLLPEYAIVDPARTLSMPSYLTACTGADALAQAIESFWSTKATATSKKYSRKALQLILPALEKAVHSPTLEERQAMSYGSYFAGKAINIARTTGPHALSYTFTTQYGIPHGHAVSLTLPQFFLYNSEMDKEHQQDSRGTKYIQETHAELCTLLGVKTAAAGKTYLEHLFETIGLKRNLPAWNISEHDVPFLTEGLNQERLRNNPKIPSPSDLTAILQELL